MSIQLNAHKKRISPVTVLSKTVVWIYISLSMLPIIFMISTSLKDSDVARQMPPQWLFTPKFQNYLNVLVGAGGHSQGENRGFANELAAPRCDVRQCHTREISRARQLRPVLPG